MRWIPGRKPNLSICLEPPHFQNAQAVVRRVSFFEPIMKPRLIYSLLLVSGIALPPTVWAAHGFAQFGEPKYPANFQHFDYVNPDAPKGGILNLSNISQNSSFDKYNPFSSKGKPAPGLAELVFETLTVYSLDEINTQYGLLAEYIQVAPDFSSTTFRLRAQARFSNGDPVTAKDVLYSFKTLNSPKASPRFRSYFNDIAQVVVDPLTVRFAFKRKGRDLPFVAGSLPIFSAKWGGVGPDGQKISFDKLRLEPPIASGPYRVDKSPSGRNVIYTRNPDYWGKDIPVRRGSFNFDKVVYKLYKDTDTQVAAMRAGDFDFYSETRMRYWCCQFIGKRFDEGEIIKELVPHKNPRPMNGYIFNLRRPEFQDVRGRVQFPLIQQLLPVMRQPQGPAGNLQGGFAQVHRQPAEWPRVDGIRHEVDRTRSALAAGQHRISPGQGAYLVFHAPLASARHCPASK